LLLETPTLRGGASSTILNVIRVEELNRRR
jgi:hypothetical protein